MTSAKDLSKGHELIIAGGFDDADQTWSLCQSDISQLKSNHEEADNSAHTTCEGGQGSWLQPCGYPMS